MVNRMEELKLKISGMSCQMCVKTIKNLLSELEGIINVDIDLEAGLGTVTYDEKILNEEEILKNEAFELYPAEKLAN
ncbi:heavy-metal transport ATPase related protein [Methanococcus maripaludis S2]|uniref:Heavy-metal transport ATPase related protein n=2 Tax=Methanococcus maripaludis TaxID=39152 RepID=Q6LY29_METMP|nr:heavy-metal transport ATPase related protein [Methanococcus maripaludis S2]